MASRRMISKRIISSSKFLQLPLESQAFFFHLIVNADDDGIIESYSIKRILNIEDEFIKFLIEKGFISTLTDDNQVLMIDNWLEHNKLRADRKVDSLYKELIPDSIKTVDAKPRSDVIDNSNRIYG